MGCASEDCDCGGYVRVWIQGCECDQRNLDCGHVVDEREVDAREGNACDDTN